jgi:signal transduction histidine kinase/DNA-binding response OmpR family regulator
MRGNKAKFFRKDSPEILFHGLMIHCIVFILLSCFITVSNAFGQTTPSPLLEVAHFSIEQGLSDRYLNCIAKDRQGFLWVGTNKGLNRFDGYEFLNYDARPSNPHKIRQNKIHSIYADRGGNLFLVYDYINSGVIDLLNPLTGQCDSLVFKPTDAFQGKYLAMKQHADGRLFFYTQKSSKQSLFSFEENSRSFRKLFEFELLSNNFIDFLPASDGTFWVAEGYGNSHPLQILQMDSAGRPLRNFDLHDFKGLPKSNLGKILLKETASGEILLYAEGLGVWVITPTKSPPFLPHPKLKGIFYEFVTDGKGNLLVYHPKPNQPDYDCMLLKANGEAVNYSWIMNYQSEIRRVFSDDFTQGFIAGTGNGFNSFRIRPDLFQSLLSAPDLGKAAYGKSIRGMAKLGKNKLFIATELDGLFELDLKTQTVSRPGDRIPSLRQLNTIKYCRNLLAEGDSVLWITCLTGIMKYNYLTSELRFYKIYEGNSPTGDHETWGITKGKNFEKWIVMRDGRLLMLKPGRDTFDTYKNKDGRQPLPGTQPSFLLAAKDGTLWIGTSLSGLFWIDPLSGRSKNYNADPGSGSGLTSNHIGCLYEDDKGMLWVGTMESGLHLFDPKQEKVVAIFDRTNGLRNNIVVGILPDSKGNYWVSTFSGLSYFDTKQKSFRNFTTANGLSHNEFNRHAFYFDKDYGRYYFGGMNGVNSFQEDITRSVAQNASLLVSEMWVTDLNGKTTGQQEGIVDGTTLTLSPGSRFLRLRLSLLTYGNNSGNQFAYMFDGAGNDWNYLGQGRDLRIDYPPAGTHTLHIKGADVHGNWSDQEIKLILIVKEFWYKRWWAFCLYALILAAGVYYFYRFQLSRSIAEKEASRLQQLDTFKTRFFTNISHEFRTPLTVILGMLDSLKRNAAEGNSAEVDEHAEIIKRNSRHLLNLVNQLLDLARLESGKLLLSPSNGDLVSFIQYQVESFRSYALSRGINLSYQCDRPSLEMGFDFNKLQGILVNLISNALKFTPEGGAVRVEMKTIPPAPAEHPKEIILEVNDSGIGIAREDLPRIFDRFYQVDDSSTRRDSGTGIGLALVQELVKLMNGSIAVESQPGKGTSFRITLPFTKTREDWNDYSRDAAKEIAATGEIISENGQETTDDERPALLIVEDNSDVRYYISENLKNHYRLAIAINGAEGIEKAREMVPDLIISDVMMPEKDGFELCKILKADELTSHIPIILLTARADVESRIAGLKRGADAYLAKPFEPAELLVHVENLINIRRQLQRRYASVVQFPPPPSADSELEIEDAFILKIKEVVIENLQTEDFDIPQLGRALGMSRSQLFRKVKALTGGSPSLLIRSIRLQKAQNLLGTTNLSISEIAYEVGFSTPAYFSTAFLEAFGKAPGEWRQQHKSTI